MTYTDTLRELSLGGGVGAQSMRVLGGRPQLLLIWMVAARVQFAKIQPKDTCLCWTLVCILMYVCCTSLTCEAK